MIALLYFTDKHLHYPILGIYFFEKMGPPCNPYRGSRGRTFSFLFSKRRWPQPVQVLKHFFGSVDPTSCACRMRRHQLHVEAPVKIK